ncbi:hypothetical protein [Commensalibacter papalotli (ex Botero et al. 2024)]|uniref:hypothetical protein n=1 Tax=Commensalibacter papalotli (ex Botero et al. 2024) TaxID=2972766 RepID=UPI0022FF6391|nr:hypothetical protein [Commensalibacter papalotli (ex Botero et al. 2024)]CAI3928872.1 unnamed protein product [Commensalibacter papalotli (ex Botero et al. 2024)]
MNLMLDIINDYLWNGIEVNIPIIQEVLDLLRKKTEHQHLLEYLSIWDEVQSVNLFSISRFTRQISLGKD